MGVTFESYTVSDGGQSVLAVPRPGVSLYTLCLMDHDHRGVEYHSPCVSKHHVQVNVPLGTSDWNDWNEAGFRPGDKNSLARSCSSSAQAA